MISKLKDLMDTMTIKASNYNRTVKFGLRIHVIVRETEQEARDYFKDKVYQTVIPRNVRLSEAPSHGVPVLIYDKSCPGSKSYYSFTDEFIVQENKVGSAA